jgi:hypothetical protein
MSRKLPLSLERCGMVLALLLTSWGCDAGGGGPHSAQEEIVQPAPPLIRRPGTYALNQEGMIMRVWPGPGSITFYQLGNAADPDSVLWSNVSSVDLPWFLHWSSEGVLWVFGDETGVFGWERPESGPFERFEVGSRDIDRWATMPEPFFNALPAGMNEKWIAIREPRE